MSSDLNGKRVLIVEDEFMIASDLAQVLEQAGAEILGPVPSIDEASRIIEAGGRIDAAVLDVDLRGLKVWPVADKLLARGVPMIFTTGYEARLVAKAYSDIPRYEKPVDPARIVEALIRSQDPATGDDR